MATARGFVFAAEEDFGIVPVEAQAEGTPVMALGRGGVRESVVVSGPRPTGLFFDQPEPPSIAAAINAFLALESRYSSAACREQAQTFSAGRFRRQLMSFVEDEIERADGLVLGAARRGNVTRVAAE